MARRCCQGGCISRDLTPIGQWTGNVTQGAGPNEKVMAGVCNPTQFVDRVAYEMSFFMRGTLTMTFNTDASR